MRECNIVSYWLGAYTKWSLYYAWAATKGTSIIFPLVVSATYIAKCKHISLRHNWHSKTVAKYTFRGPVISSEISATMFMVASWPANTYMYFKSLLTNGNFICTFLVSRHCIWWFRILCAGLLMTMFGCHIHTRIQIQNSKTKSREIKFYVF